jgi:hypothetical protein
MEPMVFSKAKTPPRIKPFDAIELPIAKLWGR